MKNLNKSLRDIDRTRLFYNKETTAIQVKDELWTIKFVVPDDNINKTRRLCGASEEAIILSHTKNSEPQNDCNYLYMLKNRRTKNKLLIVDRKASPVAVLEIRNKDIFKKQSSIQ